MSESESQRHQAPPAEAAPDGNAETHDAPPHVALQALDLLSTAVFIVDAGCRVIEHNGAGALLLRAGDGLILRAGRLGATRRSDDARLAAAITAAAAAGADDPARGYLLVHRPRGLAAYALTVAPLQPQTAEDLPAAMVAAVNPEWQVPSDEALIGFFGLSPAESRMAAALMRGRRLKEIAADTHVEVTTLRTQLSSALRKIGVARQADLTRALGSIATIASTPQPGPPGSDDLLPAAEAPGTTGRQR